MKKEQRKQFESTKTEILDNFKSYTYAYEKFKYIKEIEGVTVSISRGKYWFNLWGKRITEKEELTANLAGLIDESKLKKRETLIQKLDRLWLLPIVFLMYMVCRLVYVIFPHKGFPKFTVWINEIELIKTHFTWTGLILINGSLFSWRWEAGLIYIALQILASIIFVIYKRRSNRNKNKKTIFMYRQTQDGFYAHCQSIGVSVTGFTIEEIISNAKGSIEKLNSNKRKSKCIDLDKVDFVEYQD